MKRYLQYERQRRVKETHVILVRKASPWWHFLGYASSSHVVHLKGAIRINSWQIYIFSLALCEQIVPWREKWDLPRLSWLPRKACWRICLSRVMLLDCGFLCNWPDLIFRDSPKEVPLCTISLVSVPLTDSNRRSQYFRSGVHQYKLTTSFQHSKEVPRSPF